MNEPMIIWIATIVVLVAFFVFKTSDSFRKHLHGGGSFIEIGKEEEEFFCPGDKEAIANEDQDEYDTYL